MSPATKVYYPVSDFFHLHFCLRTFSFSRPQFFFQVERIYASSWKCVCVCVSFTSNRSRVTEIKQLNPYYLFNSPLISLPVADRAMYINKLNPIHSSLPSQFLHPYISSVYSHFCFFFFLWWPCGPTRAMISSFLRFLDHTLRHSTAGMTPLDV